VSAPGREPRAFYVVRDRVAVLQVEARPGHLRSMAPPPEGWTPPTHPFVDASSLDPLSENNLRTVLLASDSFEDFVYRLIDAGYDLMSRGNDTWSLPRTHRIRAQGRVVGAFWGQRGQFTGLHWQPTAGTELYPHATVTAYTSEHSDMLHGALAASQSLGEFESVLKGMGLDLE
jgi:hypothetical protein